MTMEVFYMLLVIVIIVAVPLVILLISFSSYEDLDGGGATFGSDGATIKGDVGESMLYNTLVNEIGIPEEYILRNVYIPIGNNMTTELDLVVVTKKGVFVFECKNYAGNIYGDAKMKQWIQYVGNKKSYFYNPLMQNAEHCRHLRKYLSFFGSIPVISLVSATNRGKWKVRNLGPKDRLLGYNCHFKSIYENMDDSIVTELNRNNIVRKLKEVERPGDEIRQRHINNVTRRR